MLILKNFTGKRVAVTGQQKLSNLSYVFLIFYQIRHRKNKKMLETTSNISVNENKSQAHLKKQQSLTLPNIHKKKVVSQPRSQSQFDQKEQLTLPNIFTRKKQQQIYSLRKNDQIDGTFMDFSAMKQKNKDRFAREVRQKLGLVLGQIPQIGANRENEEEYSQDSDFEAKINKNKQLIKQHRIKRENEENKSGEKRKKNKQENPRKLTKMRNQSLYEKRVKDYRNQSIENKYLQKRKQVISDKQKKQKEKLINFIRQNYNQKSVETSPSKESKNKNEYNSIKKYANDKNYKIESNKSQSKKNSPASISYKQQAKSINNVSKTVTLFDGIQNFLENPRNQLKEGGKHLVGLTLLKVKRDIEDKIKNINQKLGTVQNQHTPKKVQLKSLEMGATALNWQKIEIRREKVDCHHSSFDKQLERINSLQERNSLCLYKFLEHQKILLELEFRKRDLPRMVHTNSH